MVVKNIGIVVQLRGFSNMIILNCKGNVWNISKVWMLTSGANLLKSQQPNLYHDLLKDDSFQCWDEIIMNDLNRTYPDNIYFIPSPDGKLHSLNNVLRASARHNTSVGYCQVIWHSMLFTTSCVQSNVSSSWYCRAVKVLMTCQVDLF